MTSQSECSTKYLESERDIITGRGKEDNYLCPVDGGMTLNTDLAKIFVIGKADVLLNPSVADVEIDIIDACPRDPMISGETDGPTSEYFNVLTPQLSCIGMDTGDMNTPDFNYSSEMDDLVIIEANRNNTRTACGSVECNALLASQYTDLLVHSSQNQLDISVLLSGTSPDSDSVMEENVSRSCTNVSRFPGKSDQIFTGDGDANPSNGIAVSDDNENAISANGGNSSSVRIYVSSTTLRKGKRSEKGKYVGDQKTPSGQENESLFMEADNGDVRHLYNE